MSGSSNSYSPKISSASDSNCQTLTLVTHLTSPNVSIISNLQVGDFLEIVLISPASIQVLDSNGQIAGVILHHKRDQLISCIHGGTIYGATITKISGGNCEIRIRAI